MRDPVYLVLKEFSQGEKYQALIVFSSLAEARKAADGYARTNPGITYVIAPIGQAVTAEIATRWDE